MAKEEKKEEYVRPASITFRCYYCVEHDMRRMCEMHMDSDSYYSPSACPYSHRGLALKPYFKRINNANNVLDDPAKAVGEHKRDPLIKAVVELEKTLTFLRDVAHYDD